MTKLKQLEVMKRQAEAELAELGARVEALDAAIDELDPQSPAIASMKAERDAIASRVTYVSERAAALAKAHDKEPKPEPAPEE